KALRRPGSIHTASFTKESRKKTHCNNTRLQTTEREDILNSMMLRLLLLTLLLTVKASETDIDGSGNMDQDDEEDDEQQTIGPHFASKVKNELGINNDDPDVDGSTTIIIIAAVSVVTLAIVATIVCTVYQWSRTRNASKLAILHFCFWDLIRETSTQKELY
ncbi:hypothetical protein QTP86_026359, partial [Hemibagrus guttatus]